MRRKLFNLAALLSLLLCVATMALWVMSYRRTSSDTYADLTGVGFHSGRLAIGSTGGEIAFEMWKPVPFSGEYYRPQWGGFGFNNEPCVLYIAVPHWFFAATTFVVPLLWVVSFRRRHQRGLCGICSYNLTGNTSGVCPECGTAVTGKVGA